MKKYKIYVAGDMFNEAAIKQRLFEGKRLREELKEKVEVFVPNEQPFNTNKASLPSPITIYNGDEKAVIESDILLVDITNEDPGVMTELGIAFSNNIYVVAVCSDIRLPDAHKYEIPTYGLNHFVLGGILKYGVLVRSFDEALEVIKKYTEE